MPQLFRETANIDSKLIRKVEGKELQEKLSALPSTHLTEALAKGATGWEVPISRYDEENANGRLYPKALWERVLKEQEHIWKGAPMLADHPAEDQDGSPQNICGVWLEARIAPDGYVYGTFAPSGRLGEDLQDHLSKGLRAGTSSSGFGDLLQDGKTVDPSTYLIERLSDWVLSPSQGTYFTYEAATRETKNASEYQRLGEALSEATVIKENVGMKRTKLEEKKFRRDMELFLEDASKIDDPQGRLKEFEEILSYLDEGAAPDLKEQVEEKIAEQRAQIANDLLEVKKLREELGVKDSVDLKNKLTVIADDTVILQEEAKDWKQIASALQKKLDALREQMAALPTEAYTAHLRNKIAKMQAEQKVLREKAVAKEKALFAKVKKAWDAEKEAQALVEKANAVADKQRALIERLTDKMKEVTDTNTALAKEHAKVLKEHKQYVEAVAEANRVHLAPSPSTSVKKYVDFRESKEIDGYWSDLLHRHGEDIKPFEETIRSCKTLREASAAYIRILPDIRESEEIDAMRLPESVAVSMKERGVLLEKAGVRVDATAITDRLPKGWV